MTPEKNARSLTAADIAALAAMLPWPMPWAEFLAEIRPAISRPGVGKSQERKMRHVVGLLTTMGVASTSDLNLDLVSRFVASRPAGQSPQTLRSLLLCVSRLCSLAVERRALVVSPFSTVPIGRLVGPVGPPRGKLHMTKDECRRLLALLHEDIETRKGWSQWKARRLYVVACIGLYCGLRKMELLMLQVSDLDFEARVIRLVPHNPEGKFKTGKSAQPVPMPKALMPILQDWLAHRLDAPRGFRMPRECVWLIPTCDRKKPWTGGCHGVRPLSRLQVAGKRAGIGHITLHMLRRSCATHLEALPGASGALITRVMRHASEQVTMEHYRKPDEANLADAVADFDF